MSSLWMKNNKLLFKDGKILLADECCCGEDDPGGGDDPCTGTDPLCIYCPCESYLRSAYTVVISGFPAICGAEKFNGAWTVPHIADCIWRYDIDEWYSVQLAMQAGFAWRVNWSIANSGGLGGYYSGYFGEDCQPETHEYYYAYDFTYGCTGLRNALYTANVSVLA